MRESRHTSERGSPGVVGTQALARGVGILEALSQATEPIGIEELAESVGVPNSTAYRIVRYLEQAGLVERSERGSIALGLRLLDLARITQQQVESSLLRVARPKMQDLAQLTQETVMLMAPTGGQAVCLEYIESPRPIRLSFERGRAMPLHAGASSKVLLAFLDEQARDRAVEAAEGAQLENGHIVSATQLSQELAQIRRVGYCVSQSEVNLDTVGVSAPVFRQKKLVAGLIVAGPSHQFTGEQLSFKINTVVSTARDIGRELQRSSL